MCVLIGKAVSRSVVEDRQSPHGKYEALVRHIGTADATKNAATEQCEDVKVPRWYQSEVDAAPVYHSS